MPKGIYIRTKENCKGMKGKHHSEETKRKLRLAGLKRKHSEETKRKLREINLGKKYSKETKEKVSKANFKRWAKISKEERTIMTKNFRIAGTMAAQKASPSSVEIAICKVLDSLDIEYKTQVSFCYGKFIADIYIYSKNLIIECNGTYWHNYEIFPEKKKRDEALQRYCDKWGIKLVWLWEDKIKENPKLALISGLKMIK